ncbi:hypothetical protein Bca4012_054970 [Brassica carinata]
MTPPSINSLPPRSSCVQQMGPLLSRQPQPLVHTLSSRAGVLCCKVMFLSRYSSPPFRPLGLLGWSLPSPSKTLGFNAFIGAYFSFLDQYSFFVSDQISLCHKKPQVNSVNQELESIEKLQSLLYMPLQIRPMADKMKKTLILEAMDRVVIEIFDVYGRIRSAIAKLLIKLHPSAG